MVENKSLDPALLQMLLGPSIIKPRNRTLRLDFFWVVFARILWFFCFLLCFSLPPSNVPRTLHQVYTKTPNPSSILPSSMPSYSIRLHGPLLCPLPRPRLKEKRQKEHLEGAEIK